MYEPITDAATRLMSSDNPMHRQYGSQMLAAIIAASQKPSEQSTIRLARMVGNWSRSSDAMVHMASLLDEYDSRQAGDMAERLLERASST